MLTHWGQVTHICVSKRSTIASDNGTKPLPEPMLAFCQLHSWEHISVKIEFENAFEIIVCQSGDHFVQGRWVNVYGTNELLLCWYSSFKPSFHRTKTYFCVGLSVVYFAPNSLCRSEGRWKNISIDKAINGYSSCPRERFKMTTQT